MDNAINDLLDAIIPDLANLVADMRFWIGVAMVVGPVLFLALAAYYLFLSPPEANHKAGYRTYFGMGSLPAWRYTQNFAGKVFAIAGGLLTVAAIVGCIMMANREMAEAFTPALIILVIEVAVAVIAYAVVEITVACRFDANGNRRKL